MADDADGPFVGADEVRQLMGVNDLSRVTRWYKAGRLPPPYARPKCGPVWFKEDIEAALARDRAGRFDESLRFHEPPDELPILGVAEVAELLSVDKSQIGRWLREPPKSPPLFPDPMQKIVAGRLWWPEDILRFAAAWGRPVRAA